MADQAPLPTGLAGLSEERRAELAQRQQQERSIQQQLQQQSLIQFQNVINSLKGMCWFLFFRCACTLAFGVLIFNKLGQGKDYIPWISVFTPMLVAASLRVLGSLWMLRPQIPRWRSGQESTAISQIGHAFIGVGWLVFYYLLVQHLEGHSPRSIAGGVCIPMWVAMAASVAITTLFHRPLKPETDLTELERVASAQGVEVRRTGSDMFWKEVNENAFTFTVLLMVGRKADGEVAWSSVSSVTLSCIF